MEPHARAFLQQILETPSPSGYERPVQDVVRSYVAAFADRVTTDLHGNVIACKNPDAALRILSALEHTPRAEDARRVLEVKLLGLRAGGRQAELLGQLLAAETAPDGAYAYSVVTLLRVSLVMRLASSNVLA